MADVTLPDIPALETAPEAPPSGPLLWMRENLFSSVLNSILTIALAAGIFAVLRGVLGWAVDPIRKWSAVSNNARLLSVQAYPAENFVRIWITVGVIFALAGLSAAAWRIGGGISVERLTKGLMVAGSVIGGVAVLTPGGFSGARLWMLVAGALLLGVGWGWRQLWGRRVKDVFVPLTMIVGLILLAVVALLWVLRLPVAGELIDGVRVITYEPIADSTRIPWVVMMLTLIVAYVVGLGLRQRIPTLTRVVSILWVMSFPITLMVVMRAPDIDWGAVAAVDVPIFLVVGALASVALYWMGNPSTGESGRIVSAVWVLGIALWFWQSWRIDLPSSLDFLKVLEFKAAMMLGALFAVAAPSFGGPRAARLRYLGGWWASLFFLIAAFRLGESASILTLGGSSFVGGLALTFTLAIAGIGLSFPLGILLALGRSSTMPIVRTLSTGYIELVRSVPLITWLFVGSNLLPLFLPEEVQLDQVVRAIAAIALFSAAYLAENVRGGLQSIPKGQYEAADAVGMSTVQKISLITMPQALKAVIPALVGQVIALFKDTSLVAIIGLFDILYIARSVIPGQTASLGSIMETTVAAAIIYWVFTFNFSRASMRLERKLGLGER